MFGLGYSASFLASAKVRKVDFGKIGRSGTGVDICSHTILTIPASVRFRIRDSDKFPVLSSRAPLPSVT